MTELAAGGRSAAEYVRGALYGLAAVSIWSGWIVVARLGLKSSLTPWDIAALRFGVAGLLLLPYVVSKGLASRSPRLDRAGGDRARRRRTRPVRERRPDVRPGRACGSVVSRRHAADGRASCGSLPARAVYGCEKDRLRADPFRRFRQSHGAPAAMRSSPGRPSGICCFSAPLWPGPSILSRCVVRGLLGCMPRPSRQLAPWFSTCRFI